MYLFSFLLFPVVFAFFIYKDFSNAGGFAFLKNKFLPCFFSLCCAVFLSVLFEYFIFLPQYHGQSKIVFFLLNWLLSFVLPSLFYVLYVLWSKDGWSERIQNFFYFMMSFYAIYLPFLCFSTRNENSFFTLFFEPVLFLFMIFPLRKEVDSIFEKSTKNPGKIIKNAFFILAESSLPTIIYLLWHFDYPIFIWVALSFLYVLFCAFYAQLGFANCAINFVKRTKINS